MDIYEIIGYISSVLVAASITVSSVLKFRWINFAGAASFSIYGFLINAYPVGVLNGFIAIIDVYYLIKIYKKSEDFSILEINDSNFLKNYLEFHKKDINKFFPNFKFQKQNYTFSYYILRNMNVAGIFLAYIQDGTLKVELDYVGTEYRDYKNGRHIYHRLSEKIKNLNYNKITAIGYNKHHIKYLEKMGFKNTKNQNCFEKLIN